MKTKKQLFNDSLEVQNACNLLGVSKAFARALDDLTMVLRDEGNFSHETLSSHPITALWLDKLLSLTNMQFYSESDLRIQNAYETAFNEIKG
jgi:hypothetical protein